MKMAALPNRTGSELVTALIDLLGVNWTHEGH